MYNVGEKKSTREAYGMALKMFGNDENIVVLDADLSKSTKTDTFKKEFPKRHINMGIAEGNMMSVAAGIASCGKTVFASSFAIFAAGRAFEQIRNSIAYPKLNVKIAPTHAGISVGEDGATHQAVEDIALMRSIPGMVVLSPADANETILAVKAAIEYEGPCYIRMGRLDIPVIFDEEYKFEIGKGVTLKEGTDITIIATGTMVSISLDAAAELEKEGINARVVNISTIKPIDKDIIIKAASETGAIVTCEEHNIYGGLGSAVAEVLSENSPVIMKRVGVCDSFGKSGAPYKVMEEYGLDVKTIVKTVKETVKLK